VSWIRIDFDLLDPDPDPGQKSRKKLRKCMFRSAGCSLLRAGGFSCTPVAWTTTDVHHGGLGVNKTAHQNLKAGSAMTKNAGSGSVWKPI
jgi:hypothetical protein